MCWSFSLFVKARLSTTSARCGARGAGAPCAFPKAAGVCFLMWWSSLSLCAWPLQSQGEARPKKYNGAGPAAKPQALSACFAFAVACARGCTDLHNFPPTHCKPRQKRRGGAPLAAPGRPVCAYPHARARATRTLCARDNMQRTAEEAQAVFPFLVSARFPPFASTHTCARNQHMHHV